MPPNIAIALRLARRQAGLTQEELAERVGLSKRSIQDYERGVREPLSHLEDLQKALELPEGYFISQVNVIDRILLIEDDLAEIKEAVCSNQELLRDIIGALRVLGK